MLGVYKYLSIEEIVLKKTMMNILLQWSSSRECVSVCFTKVINVKVNRLVVLYVQACCYGYLQDVRWTGSV